MKQRLIASAAVLIISLSVIAVASAVSASKNMPDRAMITKQIQKVVPDATVDNITPSPVAGLFEVTSGSNVFYTTQTGDYAIYGHMLDLKNKEPISLTEQALKKFRMKILANIDPQTLVTFAPKSGKTQQTITVFTDIDCAYCRKFHQEVPKLNEAGIAVRYVSFPRAGVDSESFAKAVAVWCADDQKDAMTKAKSGQAVEKKAGCDKSDIIRGHLKLVEALDLQATPVVFLEDGTEIPGYMPADRLLSKLAETPVTPS